MGNPRARHRAAPYHAALRRATMYRATMYVSKLLIVTIFVFTAPLIVFSRDLSAQSDSPSRVAPDEVLDDATFVWQSQPGDDQPPLDKEIIDYAADNVDKQNQYPYHVYLPGVQTEEQVGTAQAKQWYNLMTQTFEGSFPTANWIIVDYNGGAIGTPPAPTASTVWDDTSSKAYQGYWSAHPNRWSSYGNSTDTWMRYGPLNLKNVGTKVVTDARFSFMYYLDTETYYDYFSFEYSCNGTQNWVSQMRSGSSGGKWVLGQVHMKECIGSDNVHVRLSFRSDYSGTKPGVWVDNISVQKYY